MGVVLREFDIDDAGVPRAQAAQFLANGTGIVSVIEPLLALTISGPPAIPAGIPTSDPRIGSGSKCDAVRHYALLSLPPSTKVIAIASFSQTFNAGPSQTRSGPKKDTTFEGSYAEREGRRLPKATCTGTRHFSTRNLRWPPPEIGAGLGRGPPIRFRRRLGPEGVCRSGREQSAQKSIFSELFRQPGAKRNNGCYSILEAINLIPAVGAEKLGLGRISVRLLRAGSGRL
jgi:hypothetical protein